tara:strand:- start:306 stop:443 length:138 start_codon:yes stop_codon:yes gene_type:complete
MSTLVKKVKGLDAIDKTGLAIGVLFIIPSALGLIVDVIVNGANML